MKRIAPERRDAIVQKMMPPTNRKLSELSKEEGISAATLYNWRTQAKLEGMVV